MDAQQYLKDILQDDGTGDAPESPANDPRIDAALAAERETFTQELRKRDEKIAEIEKRTAGPDPNKTIVINGKVHNLPQTEEEWQAWLGSARKAVKDAENPEELQPAYEEFLGRYYRWQGEQAADRRFNELKSTLPRAQASAPANSRTPAQELDALGLTPDTKGRKAIDALLAAGKSLDDAIALVDFDGEVSARRSQMQNRAGAATAPERTQFYPPEVQRDGMRPPTSVRERRRGKSGEIRKLYLPRTQIYGRHKLPVGL